jgi:hypothetical protein
LQEEKRENEQKKKKYCNSTIDPSWKTVFRQWAKLHTPVEGHEFCPYIGGCVARAKFFI